jgi:hypothetical protein
MFKAVAFRDTEVKRNTSYPSITTTQRYKGDFQKNVIDKQHEKMLPSLALQLTRLVTACSLSLTHTI